jgi:RNA 3'-terminal phosphate cyclase-like protein
MSGRHSSTLKFEDGAVQFRLRLVVSLLSSRPILIRNIRTDRNMKAPGLRPYEVSFLRLLDRITNGSQIEINSSGTQVRFLPGILVGGTHQHECPVLSAEDEEAHDIVEIARRKVRSIGWFIEGVLPLIPFGKEPLTINFTGLTDGTCESDPSVDYWQATALPLLAKFGVGSEANDDFMAPDGPALKINQRAAVPLGQHGKVTLYCPNLRASLKSIDWTDEGKIKRVRGQAISCKLTSSSASARVAYACKGLLHRLLPDVWIHTNVHTVKQHQCGPSPSLSLILTAESTTGARLTTEVTLNQDRTDSRRETPEGLGQRGAALLLSEIQKGGVIDTSAQTIALLWMCLTPEEDVSRIRIGTLSAYSIAALRLFKAALGVECKIKPDLDTRTVLVSCIGTGYRNMARAST